MRDVLSGSTIALPSRPCFGDGCRIDMLELGDVVLEETTGEMGCDLEPEVIPLPLVTTCGGLFEVMSPGLLTSTLPTVAGIRNTERLWPVRDGV